MPSPGPQFEEHLQKTIPVGSGNVTRPNALAASNSDGRKPANWAQRDDESYWRSVRTGAAPAATSPRNVPYRALHAAQCSEEKGSPVALSETDAGIAWIRNFAPADRELAGRLLDAFVLESWTAARASLLDLVRAEIESVRSSGPVWALPAMDSGDIRRANGLTKAERLIAFENYEPGMDIPSMPGSEGLIGHLIRDVQGDGILPPEAQVPELRNRRIRTILVVSDTIETGGQVAKYAKSLLRNPTLSSWRSFGWIRLVVLAYAVSREGERAVTAVPQVDSLRFVRRAPTIDSLAWAKSDIDAARALCDRYGFKKPSLGYGDHAGLFGFQDRVPNTVPRIFRQSGGLWAPLFTGSGGRQVPSSMIRELSRSSEPPVAHGELVAAARQERLSISIHKQQRSSNRDILTTLALLRASPERVTILGNALNMTQAETTGLLAYMTTQGWIDESHNVTVSGKAELAASKRKPRRVAARQVSKKTDPYYPESLR